MQRVLPKLNGILDKHEIPNSDERQEKYHLGGQVASGVSRQQLWVKLAEVDVHQRKRAHLGDTHEEQAVKLTESNVQADEAERGGQ